MKQDKNLLNKNVDGADVDTSIIKIVVFGFLIVISVIIFSYFLKSLIAGSTFQNMTLVSVSALLFLSFYLLSVFFIKGLWHIDLIFFIASVGLLAVFYEHISYVLVVTAIVVFMLLIFGYYSGRNELQNMLEIKFNRVSIKSLPKAIMALALFVGAAYYVINGDNFIISSENFSRALYSSNPIIKRIVPEFDLSASVEKVINDLALKQIDGNPQMAVLPKLAKEKMSYEIAKELKNKIEKFVGVPINIDLTVNDALYSVAVEKYSQFSENGKVLVHVGFSILMFLILIGFSWPIRWVVTIFAFLFYWLKEEARK